MKQDRYKYHYRQVPLYHSGLHVVIALNLTTAYQHMGFGDNMVKGQEPDHWGAMAWEADRGDEYGVFCLLRPDSSMKDVAHEAMHAVNYLMKRAGIHPDLNNDEPQAYLMGWVVGEIHHAMTSKKVKAKKSIKLK